MTEEDLDFPDRRQHGYVELEKRVDKHIAEIDARFRKRYKGMLIAFALIGITSTVALIGFGFVLRDQGQTDDAIKRQTKVNAAFSDTIQQQRRDSIWEACTAQNKRHDDTSNALIKAAALDEDKRVSGVDKLEVRRRRDVTLGLIDALQPKQDCAQLVKDSVKEPPG